MAELLSLPNELMGMVLNALRDDAEIFRAYKSLKILSLTSRQLRTSAQQAMYRNIVIKVPEFEIWDEGPEDYDVSNWSRLGRLVRTLLRRPDLAYMVRMLDVSITKRSIGHNRKCLLDKMDMGEDYCGWDAITALCANFLKKRRFSTGLGFNDARWMSLIRFGEQLAVLGIILACTPKLQHLAINRWSGERATDEMCYELVPKHLDFQRMFGELSLAKGFSMSWISGLANLHSISTNCIVPRELFTLPNLQCLEFGLQNRQHSWLPDAIQESQLLCAKDRASVLRRIRIILDLDCLAGRFGADVEDDEDDEDDEEDDEDDEVHYIYSYMPHLGKCLPNLSHLDLVVCPILRRMDWDHQVWSTSFDSLIRRFSLNNIETLKIDTSELSFLEVPFYDTDGDRWDNRSLMRWAQEIGPMRTLTRFTKLRKIVAAQEAFFSVDEDFIVCELPASIEEIGLVDTTSAVNRWLKHILHNKWKYPNLKSITFWGMEQLYDDPFEHDIRLGKKSDYPSEDEDMEEQQPKESSESNGKSAVLGLTESGDDDNESDETESYGSSDLDLPPQWKQEFVNASRDFDIWRELEAAGVELKEEYRRSSSFTSTKWTDL